MYTSVRRVPGILEYLSPYGTDSYWPIHVFEPNITRIGVCTRWRAERSGTYTAGLRGTRASLTGSALYLRACVCHPSRNHLPVSPYPPPPPTLPIFRWHYKPLCRFAAAFNIRSASVRQTMSCSRFDNSLTISCWRVTRTRCAFTRADSGYATVIDRKTSRTRAHYASCRLLFSALSGAYHSSRTNVPSKRTTHLFCINAGPYVAILVGDILCCRRLNMSISWWALLPSFWCWQSPCKHFLCAACRSSANIPL